MSNDANFRIDGIDQLRLVLTELVNGYPEEKRKELLRLAYMLDREILLNIPVDTGRLRASFTLVPGAINSSESPTGEGVEGHVIVSDDQVEVGTNVNYAQDVNNGHTVKQRFLPAKYLDTVKGRRYLGEDNNKGIMLHDQFIEGAHFMEKGFQSFQPVAQQELERWIQEMISKIENP